MDRYEAPLLAAAILTVLCSVLDAFLTSKLIEQGAVELNYLMANLMERDLHTFFQLKIVLTGLSVIFLVVHKNFRLIQWFSVAHLLYAISAMYLALISYESMLFRHLG